MAKIFAGLASHAALLSALGAPSKEASQAASPAPSAWMRSPFRPRLIGDWRPQPRKENALLGPPVPSHLSLQAPSGRNVTRASTPRASGNLTVIPLTGCSAEDYSGPMTIGGASTFQVIIDSGSTTAAVAGAACSACNATPKYRPRAAAQDTGEPLDAQYGSGSWEGLVYSDTIKLGTGPTTEVLFGDIQRQATFFLGGNCLSDGDPNTTALNQGIMGVGPASLALAGTSAYFDAIASQLPANVYSVAFCDIGGTMWMGGYDASSINGSLVTMPMTASPYYALDIEKILVGDKDSGVTGLDLDYGVVDTGTTQIILPTAAFQAVTQLVVQGSAGRLNQEFFTNPNWTCITLDADTSLSQLDAELPTFTFKIGNGDLLDPLPGLPPLPDIPPLTGIPPLIDPYAGDLPPALSLPPLFEDGSGDLAGRRLLRQKRSSHAAPATVAYDGDGPTALTFSATNSYLIPMLDSQGRLTVCPGLGVAGTYDLTIMGNTLMHNSVVVFDVEGQRIGWAQSKNICS